MANSLIMHKRIHTTVAKAKALRMFLEPLVTRSKEDTMHNRRMVFRKLKNKYAVTELFRNISQKVADRPGGYLRIIKLGNRLGDNAEMALIEFVDYNTTYNKEEKPVKKTRRRRRKKKTEESGTVAETGAQETTQAEKEPETDTKPENEEKSEE
jgi:large subunit ribosomal protein L17